MKRFMIKGVLTAVFLISNTLISELQAQSYNEIWVQECEDFALGKVKQSEILTSSERKSVEDTHRVLLFFFGKYLSKKHFARYFHSDDREVNCKKLARDLNKKDFLKTIQEVRLSALLSGLDGLLSYHEDEKLRVRWYLKKNLMNFSKFDFDLRVLSFFFPNLKTLYIDRNISQRDSLSLNNFNALESVYFTKVAVDKKISIHNLLKSEKGKSSPVLSKIIVEDSHVIKKIDFQILKSWILENVGSKMVDVAFYVYEKNLDGEKNSLTKTFDLSKISQQDKADIQSLFSSPNVNLDGVSSFKFSKHSIYHMKNDYSIFFVKNLMGYKDADIDKVFSSLEKRIFRSNAHKILRLKEQMWNKDGDTISILHQAILHDKKSLVKKIFEVKGHDFLTKNGMGVGNFTISYRYRHGILPFLYKEGVNFKEIDATGLNSLQTAVKYQNEYAVKFLLENVFKSKSDREEVFKYQNDGNIEINEGSLLHFIAFMDTSEYQRQIEMTNILIDAGLDVNAKDNDGDTPLQYAIDSYLTYDIPDDYMRFLLNHTKVDKNVKNKQGQNPLVTSLSLGLEEVENLIQKSKEVFTKSFDSVDQSSYLHKIDRLWDKIPKDQLNTWYSKVDKVISNDSLKKYYKIPDIFSDLKNSRKLGSFIVHNSHLQNKYPQIYRKFGARRDNIVDVIKNGSISDFKKYLKSSDPSVLELKDYTEFRKLYYHPTLNLKMTPLQIAVFEEKMDFINFIIDRGKVDVNFFFVEGDREFSALTFAILSKNIEIIQYLVDRNAKLREKDLSYALSVSQSDEDYKVVLWIMTKLMEDKILSDEFLYKFLKSVKKYFNAKGDDFNDDYQRFMVSVLSHAPSIYGTKKHPVFEIFLNLDFCQDAIQIHHYWISSYLDFYHDRILRDFEAIKDKVSNSSDFLLFLQMFDNIYKNQSFQHEISKKLEDVIHLYGDLRKISDDREEKGALSVMMKVYFDFLFKRKSISRNALTSFKEDIKSFNSSYDKKFANLDRRVESMRFRIDSLEKNYIEIRSQTNEIVKDMNDIEKNIMSHVDEIRENFSVLSQDIEHIETEMDIRHKKIQIQTCVNSIAGFIPALPTVLNAGVDFFFSFVCDPESNFKSRKK